MDSKATFKEKSFFINSHSVEYGRRIVSHDRPYNDNTVHQDLGRKNEKYNIDGFVLNIKERDDLITLCEEDKPGVLDHPHLGRVVVRCLLISVSESKDAKGLTNLSFQFLRDYENLDTSEKKKTVKIKNDIHEIETSVDSFLNKILKAEKLTRSQIDQAKIYVKTLTEKLNSIQKSYYDTVSLIDDASRLVDDVTYLIDKADRFPEVLNEILKNSVNRFISSISAIKKRSSENILNDIKRGLIIGRTANTYHVTESRTYKLTKIDNESYKVNPYDSKSIIMVEKFEISRASLFLDAYFKLCSEIPNTTEEQKRSIISRINEVSDALCEHQYMTDDLRTAIISARANTISNVNNASIKINDEFKIQQNENILTALYRKTGRIDLEDQTLVLNDILNPFNIDHKRNLFL